MTRSKFVYIPHQDSVYDTSFGSVKPMLLYIGNPSLWIEGGDFSQKYTV